MPLNYSGSKKAFKSNVKAEMDEGKPQPQSLAVAYSVQRQGKKKSKKMADGGPVQKDPNPGPQHLEDNSDAQKRKAASDSMQRAFGMSEGGAVPHPDCKADHGDIARSQSPEAIMKENYLSKGGIARADSMDEVVDDSNSDESISDSIMSKRKGPEVDDEMPSDEQPEDSIADAIRKRKNYANGGEVSPGIDDNQEGDNTEYSFYERSEDAMDYNSDDAMDGVDQPEDSNEHGHELSDEDDHDMVDSIRRKLKSSGKGMIKGDQSPYRR